MPRTWGSAPTLAQAPAGPLVRSPTSNMLAKTYSFIIVGSLSLPWLCQATITYEESSFVHQFPTQEKIHDAVVINLS